MIPTQAKAGHLKEQLQTILTNEYSDLAVKQLEVIGNGVQNVVFRGDSEKGPLAFRVPWEREVNNVNDGVFNSRISLQKEATLSKFCFSKSIPVPAVHRLHLSTELDFLISDYVASDSTSISSYKIGEALNQLHNIPIEDLNYQNEHGKPCSKLIAERLVTRLEAFNQIANWNIQLPNKREIEQILQEGDTLKKLLHMDIRPVNLIGWSGEVKAIVDWDNALIGHPLLDLMRIVETNEVNWDEFKEGYGNDEVFDSLPKIVRLFYQLDTAVMLANLFITSLKIADKELYYKERVKMLSKEIQEAL
ncbi:phosphotransferase family protein [Bacillus gaemokensis]|uniref:Aminoglycoside phosphotransferase n=1 Tax=Bacillus gaemokensis TaxID=574375 RepID=A0A073KSE9_9BACI|nr:phosphotransferase [Bacillus gaemokensis]KEK25318.1 aminoglycoside phosphotransferase [Bacillus gaemokensis]KYG37238.1 aminoglycoside phosphotransferase [Bacillus gaemokensis]